MAREKNIAIGIEDFKRIIDGNYYYVDKSSFIKELLAPDCGMPVLDGASLFLRPRRFGKTLTLSMLRYFFDIDEKENAYLFEGLAISREKEICTQFQNRFPVISLNFKDVKGNNEAGFLSQLNYCLKDEYKRHAYVIPALSDKNDIDTFTRLSSGDGTGEDYARYLSLLAKGLYAYHKVKPVVFIDEYDVPLNAAHQAGCFAFVRDIISAMFSMGLKTNANVQAAVIIGCLQIAKNQIFTGLNNLAVFTVTDPLFASSFGFTKEETAELLHSYHLDSRSSDVKKSYDGYHIGTCEIYNPFSLLNFAKRAIVARDVPCEGYWASSSGDALLREMLASCKDNQRLKETFERLVSGETVDVLVDKMVVYDTMTESNAAIMGTLLFSGYLTAEKNLGDSRYSLRVPNGEVLSCFRTLVDQNNDENRDKNVNEFISLLLKRDQIRASELLTEKIQSILCYYDKSDKKDDEKDENHYHYFLAGYFSFGKRGEWLVKSQDVKVNNRTDFTLVNYATNQVIVIEEKIARTQDDILPQRKSGITQAREYGAEYKKDGFSVFEYVIVYHNLSSFVTEA